MVKQLDQTPLKRVLPQNVEAEQMLLGSILINPDLINQVVEFLKADHFIENIHQEIYKAVLILIDKGLTPDSIKVKTILDRNSLFQELGGLVYLQKISTLATVVINPADYGKIIHDLALKRNLIKIGEEIVNNSYDPSIAISAVQNIESAEGKLFELASLGISEKSFVKLPVHIGQAIKQIHLAMKNSDHVTGISTGLLDLDSILSGFHNSDLIIFAARPGMGKTAFALNFALNAHKFLSERNKSSNEEFSIGFFSLEMSSEQLALRIISNECRINSEKLRSGKLNEEDYNSIRKIAVDLDKMSIYLDDSPALSISAVRTRARRLKRKNNLKLIIIDYLQLMKASHKSENRALEVSEITQGLKALAKELNIPIIALAQLSRAVEQRPDKRPLLSDLRESGSIEQDADIVMFLYREEYYLSSSQPAVGSEEYSKWQDQMEKVKGTADIIIAKHRHGRIGNVRVYYNSDYSKITNYQTNSNYNY